MRSRSYPLKQWPTRPNQEDGAQFLGAPIASTSALTTLRSCDRIATRCAPRDSCKPQLGATSIHHARLSTHRPTQGAVRDRTGLPLTSPPPRGAHRVGRAVFAPLATEHRSRTTPPLE